MSRPAGILPLLLAACGGAAVAPQAPPAAVDHFADVERCEDAVTTAPAGGPSIDVFAAACGGGSPDGTPWQRLERVAAHLARRRADAQRARAEDVVLRIDRLTERRAFQLPLDPTGRGYTLPVSAAGSPAVQSTYTIVTAGGSRRAALSMARLRPGASPPIERLEAHPGDTVSYPALVVADRSLPAARVLEVALRDPIASAELAVQDPAGIAAVHPVTLTARRGDTIFALDLAPGATVADLVAALDAAAGKGFAAASLRGTGPPPGDLAVTVSASGAQVPAASGRVALRLDATPLQAGIDLERHSAAIGAALTVATACVTRKGATLPAGARITIALAVDRRGKVKRARATGLDDRRTARCVGRAFRALSFPPSPAGAVDVSLPLVVEQPMEDP